MLPDSLAFIFGPQVIYSVYKGSYMSKYFINALCTTFSISTYALLCIASAIMASILPLSFFLCQHFFNQLG